MSKYDLTIHFADEKQADLIFLEINIEEALAMIDLHLKEMAACQIEKVEEVKYEKVD